MIFTYKNFTKFYESIVNFTYALFEYSINKNDINTFEIYSLLLYLFNVRFKYKCKDIS